MSAQPKDYSTDWHDEALELREQGVRVKTIARLLGLKYLHVRRFFHPEKFVAPPIQSGIRRDGHYRLHAIAPDGERKWLVADGIVIGDRSLVALGYAPAIEKDAR